MVYIPSSGGPEDLLETQEEPSSLLRERESTHRMGVLWWGASDLPIWERHNTLTTLVDGYPHTVRVDAP